MDAVVAVDGQQRTHPVNPAAEHLFGLRQAEAIGRPLASAVTETPSPCVRSVRAPCCWDGGY
jgi:PAS domain S-box-containing protein